MLDKEGAALLIDAKPETMSAFDVLDAFNDGNRLEGWICRQSIPSSSIAPTCSVLRSCISCVVASAVRRRVLMRI